MELLRGLEEAREIALARHGRGRVPRRQRGELAFGVGVQLLTHAHQLVAQREAVAGLLVERYPEAQEQVGQLAHPVVLLDGQEAIDHALLVVLELPAQHARVGVLREGDPLIVQPLEAPPDGVGARHVSDF
jgi:hypothetical protein